MESVGIDFKSKIRQFELKRLAEGIEFYHEQYAAFKEQYPDLSKNLSFDTFMLFSVMNMEFEDIFNQLRGIRDKQPSFYEVSNKDAAQLNEPATK